MLTENTAIAPKDLPTQPGDGELVRPEDGPDSPQWGELFGRPRVESPPLIDRTLDDGFDFNEPLVDVKEETLKLAAYTAAYVRACTEVLPTADPEAESVLDRALAVKSSGVRRPLRRKVSVP